MERSAVCRDQTPVCRGPASTSVKYTDVVSIVGDKATSLGPTESRDRTFAPVTVRLAMESRHFSDTETLPRHARLAKITCEQVYVLMHSQHSVPACR